MKSEKLIKIHEGKTNVPYRDTVGILTVGYGRNLEKGLSDNIIDALFSEDMVDVRADCLKFDWYHNLSPVRQAVIENMLFNLGLTRFRKFNNMLRAVSISDFETASEEMLDSKWARQVGYRADQLSSMMLRNEWPSGGS